MHTGCSKSRHTSARERALSAATRVIRRGTQLAKLCITMTICVTVVSPAIAHPHPRTSVRVMRWTFRRDHETVVCELGLNRDNSAYELRVELPPHASGYSIESFDDAMSAFHRQTAMERTLVADGWSLESFESDRVPR